MYNKKAVLIIAFIFMAAGSVLMAFMPETKFFHLPFHLMVISVILLSLFLSIKDIIIVVMLAASVVWWLGFLEVIKDISQLLVETIVLLLCASVLGWYEFTYRIEKSKQETIVEYKKEQVEEVNRSIAGLKYENDNILSEIKKHRKKFA